MCLKLSTKVTTMRLSLAREGGRGSSLGFAAKSSAKGSTRRRRSSPRASSMSTPSSSSTSTQRQPQPPPPRIEISVVSSISDIPSREWDSLVRSPEQYNPCVSYEFIRALEESGSASASRGWMPHHFVARVVSSSPSSSAPSEEEGGPPGRLVGAVPCYLKAHSRGEYVFDQGWADASHRMGKSYYPKAVVAVPMTPVGGGRLLAIDVPSPDPTAPPAATADQVRLSLADALAELSTSDETRKICSGTHVLFSSSRGDAAALGATGRFRERLGIQYHWFNDRRTGSGASASSPGGGGEEDEEGTESQLYSSFDDFLVSLKQSKRKLIRQERKRALGSPSSSSSSSSSSPLFSISRVRGTDLREDELAAFHSFYVDTCERRWGADYLTEDFFMRLAGNPDVLLVLASEPATTEIERRRARVAEEDGIRARRVINPSSSSSSSPSSSLPPPFTPFGPRGKALAGALNLVGSHALFGRNWGCDPSVRGVPFLHFELSYYQAIEAAIEAKIPRVEAGAQGEHKIARGYVPTLTRSFHALRDEALDGAVASFLRSEAREVEYVAEAMRLRMSPYKDK